MRLYDYLLNHIDEETVVWDKDFELEVYFYGTDEPTDDWDKSMMELAKLLNVVETSFDGVTVDLYELVEKHLDNLKGLFTELDIYTIMEDMEAILAGNVSDKWFGKFVEALK